MTEGKTYHYGDFNEMNQITITSVETIGTPRSMAGRCRCGFGIEIPASVYKIPVDVWHELPEALSRLRGRSGPLVKALNTELGCVSHAGRERKLRQIYKDGGGLFESYGVVKDSTVVILFVEGADGFIFVDVIEREVEP